MSNINKNYTVFHLHGHHSNINGFADSCSDFIEYIQLAKAQGMSAIGFSEHGNVANWIVKKQECDNAGIKYIHGVELYLTDVLESDNRGAHIGLYARNYDGVLEINELVSLASLKGVEEDNTDRHFYYNPRISLEELMNTSDNIIVTTACLSSPLNRWSNSENEEQYKALIKWIAKNKHRCFLEIQYHNSESQIEFNKALYNLSLKTDIPLIVGTDTHSSSDYKAECRKILQIYKKSYYGEEDEFDLTWKTYDELVSAFKKQNALPMEVCLEAIENTNVLADMVEDFELDKSFKYPTLYGDNAKEEWKQLIYRKFEEKKSKGALKTSTKIIEIYEGYINSGLPKEYNPISEEEYQYALKTPDSEWEKKYQLNIQEEFKVMSKLGMESFMMFMSELMDWCMSNDIPYGFGRGSVCGSVIAFITDITDVDPVVWDTVFSRFCNEDRVSLADIDVDFAPEDRDRVYEYIIKRFTPQKTAYVGTFQTLQDRGCIDVLAGGLGYDDLDKVAEIKDKFIDIESTFKKIIQEEVNTEGLVEEGMLDSTTIVFDNYDIYITRINNEDAAKKLKRTKIDYDSLLGENQDLFYYLDGLKGTIVSKGTHASGIVGSPVTLPDNMGVYYRDGDSNMPVTSCDMKAVDSLNFVKFDILGLKTVGIIKDTCEYIGVKYPKSYEINWHDKKVWDNMIELKPGVFQFEGSDYAFDLLKEFKPHAINHMSMVNAALRPSGKSYRDRLIAKEFNKNPSEEIDELLKDDFGYLIFQESTTKFLTDICDFTGSQADTTRRAIGKKDEKLLQEQLPKIIEGYCNHSSKPREIAEEEVKQFVQIISDSSEYQFGLNHSTAYSMNGYLCTMLRTYYPLEFTAAYLNRAEKVEDTNSGLELAKYYNISIEPIKFGKSLSEYTIDKENNTIYKGIESIKYCNSKIAEELFELSNNNYNSFINLLIDINEKTSVNARQLKILTGLNFFSDFGENQYLLDTIEVYDNIYNRKEIKKANLDELGLTEYLMIKYSNKETPKLYKELDTVGLVKEMCSKISNKSMPVVEYIKFEEEYLGNVTYTNLNAHEDYYVVLDFKTYNNPTRPYLRIRSLKTGEEIRTKIVKSSIFKREPFGEYAVLKIHSFDERFKRKKIGDEWVVLDETEQIISSYEVVKD